MATRNQSNDQGHQASGDKGASGAQQTEFDQSMEYENEQFGGKTNHFLSIQPNSANPYSF